MKVLDDLIYKKVLEIFIWVFFVILSFPLWTLLSPSEIAYAKAFDERSLASVQVSLYQKLYVLEDEKALTHLYPMRVTLEKTVLSDTPFTLVFKINKNSDVSFIKCSINEKVNFLTDLHSLEDEEYVYFLIDEGILETSKKEYEINLWLSEEVEKPILYEIINLNSLDGLF